MMSLCDAVSEHDSRGGGFYCCVDNTWRLKYNDPCPTCGKKHREERGYDD